MASQYSASVPLLLPIACEYSHMISGFRWSPERAWSTIAPISGYIGHRMSLAPWSSVQSQRMAPS